MNHYIFHFVIFLLLNDISINAQSNLLFQTKIYITDARGNIDSMTIGIDTSLATDGPIIETPFDSILEVRGAVYNEGQRFDPPPKLSKNVVTLAEQPFMYNGKLEYSIAPSIEFFVWAKYLPVTFSWNNEAWDQFSLSGSFIVPHWWSQTAMNWYLTPKWSDYACMSLDTSFTTSFDETKKWEKLETTWYRPWEIEGRGIDTLQIVELAIRYKFALFNPCVGSTNVDDEDLASFLGLKVYPTITHDLVNWESKSKFSKIEVFNFLGQLEKTFDGDESTLSLQSLSSGYKLFRFYHPLTRPISIRILKI